MPLISLNSSAGGIYWEIFLVAMDGMIMDFISILNLVRAGQFQFAAFMTFIVATSTTAELLAGCRHGQLHLELQKSVRKGIITEPLMQLLGMERAFEAPCSFALMAYAWNFAIRDWFSLITGMVNLLMGIYTLADAIYLVEDVDLHRSKEKEYELLPEGLAQERELIRAH